MFINSEMDRSIVGNLCLGKYPRGLAQFPRFVESLPSVRPNPILLNSNWLDLTMLSYLAILIRSCKRPEASATLQFESDKKYSFLWRSGFFGASHIGHRGSPFKVVPDIWRKLPEDLDSRANFTPLIVLDVGGDHTTATHSLGYSEIAKDAANSLLMELEKTLIYNLIERSDLIESREYLYIVLWELVQNVIDHAKATNAIISAQIFYKGSDKSLSGLRSQHYLEEKYCELPIRKSWLKENRERDYLMLTCVDNGIGIPASIRGKKGLQEQHDDAQLLGTSFQRESSDHDTFEYHYAIHGLHLIAQLVSSYQGYLFAQSGKAFLELTQQHVPLRTFSDEFTLPGTAFQILLPLTAGEPRPYIEPSRSRKSPPTQVSVIYATEELRKRTFTLPPSRKEQQPAVDSLIRTVSKTNGVLFLDFVGMPHERHFNSLLLLCVRRKKTDYPVIVLNASDELFTAVRGLRSPEIGKTPDKDLQTIDQTLATDLSRGEGPSLLPLVIAITRLRDASQSHSEEKLSQPGIAIQWLGIADHGPHGLGPFLVMLLDELFRAEGGVDGSVLQKLADRAGKSDVDVRTLLRNIQRANPNLITYSPRTNEWSLAFNASSLYFSSVVSLKQRLRNAVDSLAKFDNPTGAIFFLNWRPTDSYLCNYYRLWKVVRNPELARVAGTLLLRQAHDHPRIGPQIAKLSALISVTASAGLLAREMARILRIPHWEAPSVYDLKNAEWPRDFSNDQVLIVDDLIDTGTASLMIIEEITGRKAECAGVVSALASVEGHESRTQKLSSIPIVSLMEVELGRPTQEEIKKADIEDRIWDVDPHTLEPTPRKLYSAAERAQLTTKSDLLQLASHGGLRSGHFVYGGHHYYEFFDIVRCMDEREGFEDLKSWFIDSIRTWHSRVVAPVGGNSASIAIVYPYYSPIAAFLHRVQALLQDAFPFPCTVHVARPYQRSRQRVGYRVESLKVNDRFAVFVDDGVASGGTLSEVVDEFVSIHNAVEMTVTQKGDPRAEGRSQLSAAILILPFFDRIGMTPRKHLKSIDRYHGNVQFEFKPKYSLNLRSYYTKNCPLCQIESDIDLTFRTYEHVRQQLEDNLKPVRHLIAPTCLTAVATCAPIRAMKLLSNDDTATVVYASDALFSDLTSGSDIKRSIQDQKKSSIARLEILLTVMMDPILYRSVRDDRFFTDTIDKEIWTREVSSEYRSYFLLHIPHLHSEDLSRHILLKVIPKSLLAKSEPIEHRTANILKRQTPTQYFDMHPEVFACILAGIWVLRHKKKGLPKNWDTEWRQTLRDTPYAHQFVCCTSLTKEDVARAFAEMLLCNFVTHYKEHREAFKRRIENLRNLIDAGLRENPIPKHSLVYLINAIETVRAYYNLGDGLLQPRETADIIPLYDSWLAGDDSAGMRLKAILAKHFAPEQTIFDATITKQLRDGLAPTTEEIFESAKKDFGEWLLEEARKATPHGTSSDDSRDETDRADLLLRDVVTFKNEAKGLRVFGNTHFIVLTVAHLLRNAFENGAGDDNPFSSDRPKFVLTAKKHPDNSRSIIRIAVKSAQEITQDDIDRFFRAGGGLMAQKQENERWRGILGGHPTNDGHTVFFLDLDAIEMNRKGKP